MTSTYTPNINLNEPANGDYVSNWNIPLNSNFTAIDTAIGGASTINVVGVSSTPVALTLAQYNCRLLIFSGALTANVTYYVPSAVGGFWYIINNTSGAYTLTIASGGSGSSVVVAQGYTAEVTSDGTNIRLASTIPTGAAGSTGNVQINSSGVLSGSSSVNWNGSVFDVSGDIRTRQELWWWNGTAIQARMGVGTYTSNTSILAIGTDSGVTANTIAFLIGGSEAMRVASNGYVGVNTTSPAYNLSVGGSFGSNTAYFGAQITCGTPGSGTLGGIQVRGASSGGNAIIQVTDITASTQWGFASISSAGLWTWSGAMAATSFSGAGTGLTGTASSLSVGYATNAGNASTATNATNATYATTAGSASSATNATNAVNVTGTVAIGNGGTGQTTAAAALAALGGIGISASSLTGNGYVTLTNGLIIQWCTVGVAAGSSSSVTWPIAFPNAVFAAVPGGNPGLSFSGSYSVYLNGTTQTGTTAWANNGSGTYTTVNIIAIGN